MIAGYLSIVVELRSAVAPKRVNRVTAGAVEGQSSEELLARWSRRKPRSCHALWFTSCWSRI